MPPEIALEALSVSKSYGERAALRSVDLAARHGQVHGLLGPNGAGKTTLMRVLLGLVRRDAGTIRVLGDELDAEIGIVPDGVAGVVDVPAFYPYMSGRKNLELLARLDSASRSSRGAIVASALEQTGLAAQADLAFAGYSAGMRQRLGLAAALLRSPRLLFLDEPTSSLDPAAARDVRALARRLADEGAAVVLSSHDMAEVEELCRVVTIIHCGRTLFSGTVDQLRSRASGVVHTLQTSDDLAVHVLASRRPGIRAAPAVGGGFDISADLESLDAFVIALGRAGIAVRRLERRARSLESLFIELTSNAADAKPPSPDVASDEPDWEVA